MATVSAGLFLPCLLASQYCALFFSSRVQWTLAVYPSTPPSQWVPRATKSFLSHSSLWRAWVLSWFLFCCCLFVLFSFCPTRLYGALSCSFGFIRNLLTAFTWYFVWIIPHVDTFYVFVGRWTHFCTLPSWSPLSFWWFQNCSCVINTNLLFLCARHYLRFPQASFILILTITLSCCCCC